jgi:hypothetical protein
MFAVEVYRSAAVLMTELAFIVRLPMVGRANTRNFVTL